MDNLNKRGKYGIFAGLLFVIIFYVTIGYVGSFIIMSSVAGQIHATITMFDNWWQILLFIVDVLAICALVFCLIMRFRKPKTQSVKNDVKQRDDKEEKHIVTAKVVKENQDKNQALKDNLKNLYENGLLSKEDYEKKLKSLEPKIDPKNKQLLEKLAALHNAGLLTKEEYEEKRRTLENE